MNMTCGVPQGSILGPTLWNVCYDGVLKLKIPNSVNLIAYADDLAVIVSGKTGEQIRETVSRTLEQIGRWMGIRKLKLAESKTEAVVLCGRRQLRELTLAVDEHIIRTAESIKYLGVMLDRNLHMTAHVNYIQQKALKTIKAVNGILPNIGGPRSGKRRLIASVVASVILYAAPIWSKAMEYKKYQGKITQLQRLTLLRVARGYRTISADALQVICGIPPIELLVRQRCEMYKGSDRKEQELWVKEQWQKKWDNNYSKGQWTKLIIPNIEIWVNRKHEELTYGVTQLLSGHGCFRAYLHRFGKTDRADCPYCDVFDDARHTVFACPRWADERSIMAGQTGDDLTPENIIRMIVIDERVWENVAEGIDKIIREKEREERELYR